MKYFLILIIVSIAAPLGAREFTYEYEGQTLSYTVIDEASKTVQTKEGYRENTKYYAGNIVSGSISIPSVVSDGESDYSVVKIGDYSFYGCSSLYTIDIPNSVLEIGEWAFMATGLTELSIPESVTYIGECCFYKTNISTISIPNSVVELKQKAFAFCKQLKSVVLGNSISTLEFAMFFECTQLNNISLPKSLTEIETSVFENCPLKHVEFADIESICHIKYEWAKSNPLSIAHTFYIDGQEITIVDIPETVTEIAKYAFCGCDKLTDVIFPNSLKIIGQDAFMGCNSLSSLSLPDSVEDFTFNGYEWLTSVKLPSNLGTIGERTFEMCTNLKSIFIPNSVTKIGNYAFNECRSLSEVWLPASLNQVDDFAFWRAEIEKVYYPAENPIAIDSYVVFYHGLDGWYTSVIPTLYVKESVVKKCKETKPWWYFNIEPFDFSGIDEKDMDPEIDNVSQVVYDLNGRVVRRDIDMLAPGIYIIKQGHKVVKYAVKK